jgi:hypothetical protein
MHIPIDIILEYEFHYGKEKATQQRRLAARFWGLRRAASGGFASSQ